MKRLNIFEFNLYVIIDKKFLFFSMKHLEKKK